MADIDGYLKQIRSAEAGETVRDAIINCLRDINRDVPVQEEDWEGYMPESTDLTLSGHYKSVHVMHNPSSGKNTKLTTLHATENDTYEPEENEYYNKVVVEVEQSPYTIREEAVEITENGTYYAKGDWGVNGVAEIHVNVQAATSGGPFTVQFYDRPADDPMASIIYTEANVPLYGSASFKGPSLPTDPTGLGRPFAGWNPSPVNVTRDMKCYPNFVSQHMVPGEIGADWDVICADGGTSYPIGSYRRLYFSATITKEELNAAGAVGYNDDITVTFETIMIKVAEGEDGSKSTWLSLPDSLSFDYSKWADWTKYLAWPDRFERKWLQLLYTKFAPCFLQHIKPVTKYTQCSSADVPPYSIVPTQDALWCASLKELCVDNDYWTHDLEYIYYNGSREYADIKAKYYDGVPLDIPYINNANLTPKQRDDLFYLSPGQAFADTRVLLRDAGPSFSDRRVIIGTNKIQYTNPETSQTEEARYICDGSTVDYLPMIFGFCLV